VKILAGLSDINTIYIGYYLYRILSISDTTNYVDSKNTKLFINREVRSINPVNSEYTNANREDRWLTLRQAIHSFSLSSNNGSVYKNIYAFDKCDYDKLIRDQFCILFMLQSACQYYIKPITWAIL
jgi:hypothetical protein